MTVPARRSWVPAHAEDYTQSLAAFAAASDAAAIDQRIHELVEENRAIHERQCFNLNPATNVMNPRAEALLSAGIGSRPSLGYAGDKYEMGLEAIEKIEVFAQTLACEIFQARYAEIRVASGAMANLYAFMATAKAGDAIIVPPPEIGGHVTHQKPGAAGQYGLAIHHAPVNAQGYTVDLDKLAALAREVRPKLISIGGSLNLLPHPVAEIRAIADAVGAKVLFDAAHLCGMIAGGAWPDPLAEGAHMMTMSTYKSLGGPPSGLIVTDDAVLAERLEAIAYPGLTANFDSGKSAALAVTLLDWREHGAAYAQAMVATADALATALSARGVPVHRAGNRFTTSHQFALDARSLAGGQAAAKRLRKANILSCGIGLPAEPVAGDMNGLRFGTPEIVRWGMDATHMETLADLIARALAAENPAEVAGEVSSFRRQFQTLHYVR